MTPNDDDAEIARRPARPGGALPVAYDNEGSYDKVLLNAGALQKAIFNSAMFSKIATDADGVIQIFNVGAAHMLGYRESDVVGKISPADIADADELVARAALLSAEFGVPIAPGFDALVFKAARGIEDIYELTYVRLDGSRFPAQVSVTALRDARDRIIGYLLIGTDNTARKKIEADQQRLNQALVRSNGALEAARRTADSANLAKTDFLSSMSHELRSPLNAILGFAQLMAMSQPSPTADQKDSIDQILQSGWYLLELINEILDLSLIESGKLSMSPEPISLQEVLGDCESMVGPQARDKGIAVSFASTGEPRFVRADRTRLKQVLVNILSNAIKYNRPGGSVDVTVSDRLPGDAADPSPRVDIAVRDTGEGLSEMQLSELFQPFNRLGREGGPIEGTGIGLVVSKRLVELMDGELRARSTSGVGSVFTVSLPSAHEAQLKSGTLTDSRFDALYDRTNEPQRTVLCVEDNPANLALVTRLIKGRPHLRLLTARDGLAGVESAVTWIPDVILMDINLPDISGMQALAMLRQNPTTAAIPVIALSANAMPNDVRRGIEAGFFRYLTKPMKVQELMDTIDDALNLDRDEPLSRTHRVITP